MSGQARVSSIDALESFRADIVQYISKVRPAIDDTAGEVRRIRTWLDTDRLQHWNAQHKKRAKLLEQAEQELYSANLISPHAANALQKMAVAKAKRHLAEAEEKIRVIQQWRKRFDQLANPLLRDLDPLSHVVAQILPKGVVALGESIKALQDYAATSAPISNPPPIEE